MESGNTQQGCLRAALFYIVLIKKTGRLTESGDTPLPSLTD